jgi:hypothetical protein
MKSAALRAPLPRARDIGCFSYTADYEALLPQLWSLFAATVAPERLGGLGRTNKMNRMFKALWQMQKLDIKRLKAAFDGRE